MVRPNIAVIGCGYWGKNVVRTFHNLGALRCVCDVRSQVLDAAREKYGVQTTSSIAEVLADPQVEGVAIAAPAVQHYQLVRQALEAGKHVLVEKPLALHLAEGRHLAEIADSLARVLMVGHILQYHPAILKLKRDDFAGELGESSTSIPPGSIWASCAARKTYCGVFAPPHRQFASLGEMHDTKCSHTGALTVDSAASAEPR